MSSIIILLGSVIGFFGGLTAYFGFEASFWAAVTLWLAAGPTSALLVILAAAFAPQQPGYAPVLAKVA